MIPMRTNLVYRNVIAFILAVIGCCRLLITDQCVVFDSRRLQMVKSPYRETIAGTPTRKRTNIAVKGLHVATSLCRYRPLVYLKGTRGVNTLQPFVSYHTLIFLRCVLSV